MFSLSPLLFYCTHLPIEKLQTLCFSSYLFLFLNLSMLCIWFQNDTSSLSFTSFSLSWFFTTCSVITIYELCIHFSFWDHFTLNNIMSNFQLLSPNCSCHKLYLCLSSSTIGDFRVLFSFVHNTLHINHFGFT